MLESVDAVAMARKGRLGPEAASAGWWTLGEAPVAVGWGIHTGKRRRGHCAAKMADGGRTRLEAPPPPKLDGKRPKGRNP